MSEPRTKVCRRCGVAKTLEHFTKHLDGKDGVLTCCKPCVSEVNLQRYYANRRKAMIRAAYEREKSRQQPPGEER